MAPAGHDPALLRARLVEALRARGAIRCEQIAQAFAAVPREHFIPDIARDQGLEAVYRDEAFVTKKDRRGMPLSSSSQPGLMAEMLELLAAAPGQRVLEVGAGTGYNAALLARLVGPGGHVTTIDVDPQLARRAQQALRAISGPGGPGAGDLRVRGFDGVAGEDRAGTVDSGAGEDRAGQLDSGAGRCAHVDVVVGDGRAGRVNGARYDRIIVTACADQVSRHWMEQLTEAGRLVLPLRLDPDADALQVIPAFERRGDALHSIGMTWGGFMPLHGGDGGWKGPQARLAANRLASGNVRPLVSISGAGLQRLSDHAARAVLADALRQHRPPRAHGSTPLDRGHTPLILIFLLSVIPAARRVWIRSGARHGIGAVDRRGRGLAAVSSQSTWSSSSPEGSARARWRLDSYGAGGDAGEELLAALQTWRRLQRAGRMTLAITARPAGEVMRVRYEWR